MATKLESSIVLQGNHQRNRSFTNDLDRRQVESSLSSLNEQTQRQLSASSACQRNYIIYQPTEMQDMFSVRSSAQSFVKPTTTGAPPQLTYSSYLSSAHVHTRLASPPQTVDQMLPMRCYTHLTQQEDHALQQAIELPRDHLTGQQSQFESLIENQQPSETNSIDHQLQETDSNTAGVIFAPKENNLQEVEDHQQKSYNSNQRRLIKQLPTPAAAISSNSYVGVSAGSNPTLLSQGSFFLSSMHASQHEGMIGITALKEQQNQYLNNQERQSQQWQIIEQQHSIQSPDESLTVFKSYQQNPCTSSDSLSPTSSSSSSVDSKRSYLDRFLKSSQNWLQESQVVENILRDRFSFVQDFSARQHSKTVHFFDVLEKQLRQQRDSVLDSINKSKSNAQLALSNLQEQLAQRQSEILSLDQDIQSNYSSILSEVSTSAFKEILSSYEDRVHNCQIFTKTTCQTAQLELLEIEHNNAHFNTPHKWEAALNNLLLAKTFTLTSKLFAVFNTHKKDNKQTENSIKNAFPVGAGDRSMNIITKPSNSARPPILNKSINNNISSNKHGNVIQGQIFSKDNGFSHCDKKNNSTRFNNNSQLHKSVSFDQPKLNDSLEQFSTGQIIATGGISRGDGDTSKINRYYKQQQTQCIDQKKKSQNSIYSSLLMKKASLAQEGQILLKPKRTTRVQSATHATASYKISFPVSDKNIANKTIHFR